MLQDIIAVALIAGAMFLAGRFVWRTLAGRKAECNCGSAANCCSGKIRKTTIVKVSEIQKAAIASGLKNQG